MIRPRILQFLYFPLAVTSLVLPILTNEVKQALPREELHVIERRTGRYGGRDDGNGQNQPKYRTYQDFRARVNAAPNVGVDPLRQNPQIRPPSPSDSHQDWEMSQGSRQQISPHIMQNRPEQAQDRRGYSRGSPSDVRRLEGPQRSSNGRSRGSTPSIQIRLRNRETNLMQAVKIYQDDTGRFPVRAVHETLFRYFEDQGFLQDSRNIVRLEKEISGNRWKDVTSYLDGVQYYYDLKDEDIIRGIQKQLQRVQ